MTAYTQELRRCKVVLLLRAVIDAGGNMCAAARATGVHYNTIGRVLKGAGYDSRQLKRLAAQRKPIRSAPALASADRRVA